jgi:uncharacterized protein (TIRG00374 family)
MMAIKPSRSTLEKIRLTVESLPARILVTLTLLAVVGMQIDWGRMEERIRHGHPLDALAALGIVVVALTIGALRWQGLLRAADVHVSYGALARVYSVATFSGTFLPTSVGGDVTRGLLVTRRGPLLARVAMTIIVDRLYGLVGLLGMAWLTFSLESAEVPAGAQIFLAWVTGVVLVGSLLLSAAVIRAPRALRALVPRRFTSIARDSRVLVQRYARDRRLIFLALCASLAYQALISLELVVLGRAIDVHLPFATAAVTLALVTIVTLIPISVGGFGVREGSYVVLLGAASVGPTDAALISLLSVATLFVASLPGAFLFARGGLTPALDSVSG